MLQSCESYEAVKFNVVGFFLTKIFHPNIANNGEICVNTLKKDWNPSLGLRHVLIVSAVDILDLLSQVLLDWSLCLLSLIPILNRLLGVY